MSKNHLDKLKKKINIRNPPPEKTFQDQMMNKKTKMDEGPSKSLKKIKETQIEEIEEIEEIEREEQVSNRKLLFEMRSTVRDGSRKNAEQYKEMSKQLNAIENQNKELSEKVDKQFNSLNQLLMEQSQQTQATLKKIIEKGDEQTHLLQAHHTLLQAHHTLLESHSTQLTDIQKNMGVIGQILKFFGVPLFKKSGTAIVIIIIIFIIINKIKKIL
mgnify:CR=1 FL=1